MQTTKSIRLVIVEDDLYYNRLLTKYVQTICNSHVYPDLKFEIVTYTNADECIRELDDNTDIMILDYYLTKEGDTEILNGGDVLEQVNKHCSNCKVILISAMTNAHIAVDLMRHGVYEYIDKNVNSKNRVGSVIQRALAENFKSINH
jgi:response regulator of citrate/malate metabolism